jgi:broad specificity polyphosphatase/5'/3'-nucleotidase SurE
MEIFLTNDDSHNSSLFHLAISRLSKIDNLTIVVPKEEQGWTGKSKSRIWDILSTNPVLKNTITTIYMIWTHSIQTWL